MEDLNADVENAKRSVATVIEVTASTTDAVELGEKCADNAVEVNALMKELSDVVQSANA